MTHLFTTTEQIQVDAIIDRAFPAQRRTKAPKPFKHVYLKQDRDAKGHFGGINGVVKPKKLYTQADMDLAIELADTRNAVREAYMAGLNSQGGILTPARKVEMYLRQAGL